MSNVIIIAGCFIVALLLTSIVMSACKVSSECEYASYTDYVDFLKESGVPEEKIPSYEDFIMRDIVWEKK